jgi:hypothetical protein
MQIFKSRYPQFVQELPIATTHICDTICELRIEFFEPVTSKSGGEKWVSGNQKSTHPYFLQKIAEGPRMLKSS